MNLEKKDDLFRQYYEDNAGEEVDFDECDECGIWLVGEIRCKCGNRRVALDVFEYRDEDPIVYPIAY